MYLGYAFVSGKFKKQKQVSKSSMEATYRAIASTCLEIVSLQRISFELGFA